MTATIERPADDAAWLKWRAEGITATDVANAYTGSYGGKYAAVALKLGLIEPEPYTEVMARGHRWEQRIADLVHVATGLYVHGEQMLCQNADHPHHRATVDGMLCPLPEASIDDMVALLEEKTNGLNVRPSWERWRAQVQWQIHCSGIDRALIARVVVDDDADALVAMEFEWVERDEFLIGVLIDLAEEMQFHVLAGTLPAPDSASALDAVKVVTLMADPAAEVVDLADMEHDLARYAEIGRALRVAEAERDEIGARIRSALGGAKKGTTRGGFTASYSANANEMTRAGIDAFLSEYPYLARPREIDTKRAEAAQPDDFKAIPREATGPRRLTVKEPK